jgi:hypothetical protein
VKKGGHLVYTGEADFGIADEDLHAHFQGPDSVLVERVQRMSNGHSGFPSPKPSTTAPLWSSRTPTNQFILGLLPSQSGCSRSAPGASGISSTAWATSSPAQLVSPRRFARVPADLCRLRRQHRDGHIQRRCFGRQGIGYLRQVRAKLPLLLLLTQTTSGLGTCVDNVSSTVATDTVNTVGARFERSVAAVEVRVQTTSDTVPRTSWLL